MSSANIGAQENTITNSSDIKIEDKNVVPGKNKYCCVCLFCVLCGENVVRAVV